MGWTKTSTSSWYNAYGYENILKYSNTYSYKVKITKVDVKLGTAGNGVTYTAGSTLTGDGQPISVYAVCGSSTSNTVSVTNSVGRLHYSGGYYPNKADMTYYTFTFSNLEVAAGDSITIQLNWPKNRVLTCYGDSAQGTAVQAEQYTIKYDTNGGSGSFATQTKVYGQNLTLHSNEPSKSVTIAFDANGGTCSTSSKKLSATFTSWKDGDGTTYAAGGTYSKNKANTLTAQWSYATVGTLPTATRNGYTFKGWGESKSTTSYVNSSYRPTSNKTLYAQWEEDKYKVIFNANGGTVYGSDGTAIGSTKTDTKYGSKDFTIPSYTAYPNNSGDSGSSSTTFSGWNTTTNATSVKYKAGDKYTTNADITLYPVYGVRTFTVKWSDGHSENPILKTETVEYGKSAAPPKNPSREGYHFAGWLGEYTSIKSNKTIIALWADTPVWIWNGTSWIAYTPSEE